MQELNKIEECPLTKHFLETYKKAEEKTALSWMKTLNDNEIKAIESAADRTENCDDDDDDLEIMDYVTLSLAVASFETEKDIVNISSEDLTRCAIGVGLLATNESLSRKGLVTISGEGKATNLKTTTVVNTESGRIVADGYKTLKEISDLIK